LENRFLIGAGSNCDLQLGGQGIPVLHSLITLDASGAAIEAVVPAPPLVVGGRSVRQMALTQDDLIEIGPYAIVVHPGLPTAIDLMAPVDVEALLEQQRRDVAAANEVSGLNARELTDRIEAELAAIASVERGTASGLAAVLEAVQSSLTKPLGDGATLAPMIGQLEAFAAQLAADSRRMQERELALAAQSELVLALQERLIAECSRLLGAAEGAGSGDRTRLRISA
jgi:hypothetical protein